MLTNTHFPSPYKFRPLRDIDTDLRDVYRSECRRPVYVLQDEGKPRPITPSNTIVPLRPTYSK